MSKLSGLKDTGERHVFETGAMREPTEGRASFHLIPYEVLNRLGIQLAKGAVKYKPQNWRLGLPLSSFFNSAIAHLYKYIEGDTEEDHLAACMFNVGGLMFTETMIKIGALPKSLDDIGRIWKITFENRDMASATKADSNVE